MEFIIWTPTLLIRMRKLVMNTVMTLPTAINRIYIHIIAPSITLVFTLLNMVTLLRTVVHMQMEHPRMVNTY